ncbi:conserved Plasmodium protein, unknown function [Plasmodium sp. gorilla clade G2]|uniref:conserved Plasmodium protein, unknown function n=1 Tax=Plasmodium sp. gorilla clade G2 TaxID=880535 RepID=UPI000D214D29|nr:conserved Plasmodium protein, unknown function [Plasmodium sp. gorilla clade G2]SOV10910.1 conserved Plasmodium protein, unknown function [Plasmodium sp. gorilla clade G2]
MDFEICSDDDNFQKEKKEHLDISYFEKFIVDADNKENFDKSYDTYFKTVNKDFIYTCHHIFNAHNEDNVKKILSYYEPNVDIEEFNKKIARAYNFKYVLLENNRMRQEDKYLESLLKIENDLRNHKLKLSYDKDAEKVMNKRNYREYENCEKCDLEKEYLKKRKRIDFIIKYFINAAKEINNIDLKCGNSFFSYDHLCFLQRKFLLEKIEDMNELTQNNALMNKFIDKTERENIFKEPMENNEKNEKYLQENYPDKLYTYKLDEDCLFLKPHNIDSFFLLDLKNIYVGKQIRGKKKYGYLCLIKYLSNFDEYFYRKEKKEKERNEFPYDQRKKIFEKLEDVDYNSVIEKMGEKYFLPLPKEDVEKNIKELRILKFLLLKLFRKRCKSKHCDRKFSFPLKIVITGKIKRETLLLARYLKKKFTLKIYDFNKIKKEVEHICSNNNRYISNDENVTNKINIIKKLKEILKKLDEKKENTFQVDLLYYRIKYDEDIFYRDKEKRNKKIMKNGKMKKYYGYIIINFFFSLKDYIMYEYKAKKFFLYNKYIHIGHVKKEKKIQSINFSPFEEDTMQSTDIKKMNTQQNNKKIEEEEEEGKKKKNLKKKKHVTMTNENNSIDKNDENIIKKDTNILKDNSNDNNIISYHEDINNYNKHIENNILFFSNFICPVDDLFYMKKNYGGAIDFHFHIEKSLKQINSILYKCINNNCSCHMKEKKKRITKQIHKYTNDNKIYKEKEYTTEINNEEKENIENEILLYQKKYIFRKKNDNFKNYFKKKIHIQCNIKNTKYLYHTYNIKDIIGDKEIQIKYYKLYNNESKLDYIQQKNIKKDKKIYHSNFYIVNKIFQFDKNFIEIEHFLKNYNKKLGRLYERYYVIKKQNIKDIYIYTSKLLSKVFFLIKKKKAKKNLNHKKYMNYYNKKCYNNDSSSNTYYDNLINNEDNKNENIYDEKYFMRRINIDNTMSFYFKLRYCNIIKRYIIHLFNLFIWKIKMEKNIKKGIKYIYKNITRFIDFINSIKYINEFIQMYNKYCELEIKNDEVQLLLFEKLNQIQQIIWSDIIEQRNYNIYHNKDILYIYKWIYIQIYLILYHEFYLINIEHQLYIDIDSFVNELLYSIIHINIITNTLKNDKKNKTNISSIFTYMPKNTKELFTYDHDQNYFDFPFINTILINMNKLFIPIISNNIIHHNNNNNSNNSNNNSNNSNNNNNNNNNNSNNSNNNHMTHKIKNDDSVENLIFSKREKYIHMWVKEFRSINNYKFFYKMKYLLNNLLIILRTYFFIFQELNIYIYNFITLHYFCVYKKINYIFERLKKYVRAHRRIPFYYTTALTTKREKKKKKKLQVKILNMQEINNEEKQLYMKQNIYNMNILIDNRINKKRHIFNIRKFLNHILSYIYISQYFLVISKEDLQNVMISSLYFIKDRKKKMNSFIFLRDILNSYVKIYSVNKNLFILPNDLMYHAYNYDHKMKNNKEQEEHIFILHFFFFLIFYFYSKPKKNHLKKIFFRYLHVMQTKMNAQGIDEQKKIETIKTQFCFLQFDEDTYECKEKILCDYFYVALNHLKDSERKTSEQIELLKGGCTSKSEKLTNVENMENIKNIKNIENIKNITHLTYNEFASLGLFNFIKDKHIGYYIKEENENYEIRLLNKFLFKTFLMFELFPHFNKNICIYMKNYLFKFIVDYLPSLKIWVEEKIQKMEKKVNTLKVNSEEIFVKDDKNVDGLKNERVEISQTYKIRVIDIFLFFLMDYNYNF